MAYIRELNGTKIMVAANFGMAAKTLTADKEIVFLKILLDNLGGEENRPDAGVLTLLPSQALVILLKH